MSRTAEKKSPAELENSSCHRLHRSYGNWESRALSAIAVIVTSGILSACLESHTSLVDKASSTQWLDGNELLTMPLTRSFVPKQHKDGLRLTISRLSFEDNVWNEYESREQYNSFEKQYSFVSSPSSRYVMQPLEKGTGQTVLVQKGLSTYNYGFARKFDQDVPALPTIFESTYDYIVGASRLEPSEALVNRMQQAGFRISSGKSGLGWTTYISSKEALEKVSASLLDDFINKGSDLTEYDSVYLVAEKPRTRQAMLTVSNAIECLGRAGHRYDPAMAIIQSLVKGASSIDDIDTQKAQPVCEAAYSDKDSLGELRNSVIYALSRIAQKNGDLKLSLDLLKQIDDDQSGLPVVAEATIAIVGKGVENSKLQALKILENGLSSVDRGSIAEFNILNAKAWLLTNEPRDNQPENEARTIYRYLHSNNFAQGTLALARLLKSGIGGPVDIGEARSLYMGLYEANVPEAYLDLGLAAYNGEIGFKVNHSLAAAFFEDGVELAPTSYGHYLLGFMQMFGQGVAENHKEGFRNLRKSHGMGRVNATTEVGYALYLGNGTERNVSEGIELLQLARSQGDKKADQYLQQLEEADPQIFQNKNQ
jgi:TPR repeat protein